MLPLLAADAAGQWLSARTPGIPRRADGTPTFDPEETEAILKARDHIAEHASKVAAWALPFEALYQDGLRLISSNASGLTGFLLQLGPFGGAYVHGWGIRVWSAGYLCVALVLALLAFSRRDL